MRNPRPLHTRGKRTHTNHRLFVGLVNVGNVPPAPADPVDNLRMWEALMGAPTYDADADHLDWSERKATLVRGRTTRTHKDTRPTIRPVRVTTTNRTRK